MMVRGAASRESMSSLGAKSRTFPVLATISMTSAGVRSPMVFNCTGLGARELFKDEKLIPVRGQLEVLLPQPEVDYCYLAGGLYMFPRRDGIILGGTWDHDDWNLNPDPETTTTILAAHAEIMKGATR